MVISGTEQMYICEATGQPRPNVRWLAINTETGEEERIRSEDDVSITNRLEQNNIISILTISEDSEFDTPTCVAESSSGGPVMSNMFMEVTGLPTESDGN